jgi:hypothetical protein
MKFELGRKTEGPHRTEPIFTKPLEGISYTADNVPANILLPVKGVYQGTPGKLISQGIHGKVPTGKIFLDGRNILYRIRMPAVRIARFYPEGGGFYFKPLVMDRNRSMFNTRGNNPSKKTHHRFRPGIGGNIPIFCRDTPDKVPDRAPHEVGLKAMLLQNCSHFDKLIGNTKPHGKHYSHSAAFGKGDRRIYTYGIPG